MERKLDVSETQLMNGTIEIGLLLFPRLTQLDMTGPFEVFARIPGAKVHVLWKRIEPVISDTGLALMPTAAFAECPRLDVICVPGGPGVNAMMQDEEVLEFLRSKAGHAKFVTSVCTGALILGAAGLLQGYRAATHWSSMEFLKEFGATPEFARVCIDRNRVTGGGVTAGIDFGLFLASKLTDQQTAEKIQLTIEYNPAPPFHAGSPETAPPGILEQYRSERAAMQDKRRAAVLAAAGRPNQQS
jgi:cyclohexyl-isocyanide hydratase